MNDRKQHVINMAHQLFIDKGYQATSIQDILDYSGISKGTFYNYFSSKSELLIALFKSIYQRLEIERNELLIGQDPSNIEIFIKQIELQMKTSKENELLSLFQEVLVLNDPQLNLFLKQSNLLNIHWIYKRFIDIFGENRSSYLLDCAIMFMGILHQNIKYNVIAYGEKNKSIYRIVRYSVERVAKMVEEVSQTGEILIQPEILESLLPNCNNADKTFKQTLSHIVLEIKMNLHENKAKAKNIELLDFIQDELLNAEKPRKYLIESILISLKEEKSLSEKNQVQALEQLISDYFSR